MAIIKVNGNEYDIQSGITKGDNLYSLAEIVGEDKLYLDIKGEVDIPIAANDCIIILGGEDFAVGKSDIPDNPELRKPINLNLNGANIALSKHKITGKEIRENDKVLSNSKLYADLSGLPDQPIDDNCRLLIRDKDCFITIPVADDGIIDVEECAKNDRKPPKKQRQYKIKIDGEKYIADASHLSGKKILALAGMTWQEFGLQQKFKGGKREAIAPDQKIDLATPEVERFETVPKSPQQG
ncbi:multiubiquitin domain-containing protein [Candidatus Spongiihabitans sp.]|uniref:multiubiquitin domain-containing protein n=1 Tax=Candidatus Spongiihabitans sp. TaxID=3101308 RepID=UPI003C7D6C1C